MIVGWWAGGLVGWWTGGLSAVGYRLSAVSCQLSAVRCHLSSIFYLLSSIVCELSADRYLPSSEALSARTEILRFAQNDDARRTAVGGAIGYRLSAVGCRLSAVVCCLSSIFYFLFSIFYRLSADRYLPAFETLTARTEILRFAQNDDARRTAVSG